MQRIVIDIPDRKFNFFMELINSLGFKSVKPISREKQQFSEDIQHALHQVKQHQEGKIALQSAKDFLYEL